MLPILISVSLAPGSYFFSALAASAASSAAAPTAITKTSSLTHPGIATSRLHLVLPQVSQALAHLASLAYGLAYTVLRTALLIAGFCD